jgi:hypothetical protein
MQKKEELRVLILTAIVIALASVGQLGLAFLQQYDPILPPKLVKLILQLIIWTSLFLVGKGVYMYVKMK